MNSAIIEQFLRKVPGDAGELTHGLEQIYALGVPDDLFAHFASQLAQCFSRGHNAERALGNLLRFLEASRSPLAWMSLFERESEALDILARMIGASDYLAELLIRDPEAFDLLRVTDGQPVHGDVLQDEISTEIAMAADMRAMLRILRYYRHREILRIAYGDLIHGQPVDTVMSQLSILAESLVAAALQAARQEMSNSGRTEPVHRDGRPLGLAILTLGRLGGGELSYSHELELVLIRESVPPQASSGTSRNAETTSDEYFQRLAQVWIKLLSESTSDGAAYRVDMRFRPFGKDGKLVASYEEAVRYYDSAGRTWERQAFVKARCIAGDLELGRGFLRELQPWIFRRYLMRADITGLIALKRRIERNMLSAPEGHLDIHSGKGGLEEIESVIQLLQLLHGADHLEVRCTSTLGAIHSLNASGCMSDEEQSVLADNYRYLRRIEHHQQIMQGRPHSSLPRDSQEFGRLAVSLFADTDTEQAAAQLRQDLRQRTEQNRGVLEHLLSLAFSGEDFDGQHMYTAESDLLLDPEPSPEVIESTLRPYGFSNCKAAYRHLQELATESIPFLSTRRSRHFLAAIASDLLQAISQTPDPDRALISLANVSASLGGKAVLWELFSENPPSMELCVRLCASSPYLVGILTGNPGMMDELLDSLMLDSLPSHEEMAASLEQLCRGALEINPILQSFKNSMHLRVGVRDILGKSTIEETHAALSDIAEVCIEQVILHEFHRLVHRLGVPTTEQDGGRKDGAELVILAVGKLGGREPNYHSDVDLMFLFDGDGSTTSLVPNRRFEPTTNRHFFNQLCQNVTHALTRNGPAGRLYDVDMESRPLAKIGQLAISLDDLLKYFQSGRDQIWERQAICKARPIWGSPDARKKAMQCITQALSLREWTSDDTRQVYQRRLQLEQGAGPRNLKRGRGGTMDVEFVVHLLQLAQVRDNPQVLVSGTLDALQKLRSLGLLDTPQADQLRQNYQFLRSIESGIRLMNASARHDVPDHLDDLKQLAFLLKSQSSVALSGPQLLERCQLVREQCRQIFESTFHEWLPPEESTPGD
ncbi:MAG: hypothetical protein NXI32_25610 [bacterium]|nr:hypothetical protein [bacterium]